jgi:hypothetical protein
VAYPGSRPVIHGYIRISGSYLRLSGFIIEGPLSKDSTVCTERRSDQIDIYTSSPPYPHHIEISYNEIRNNDYHAGIFVKAQDGIHIVGNYIHDNGRFNISADPCTGSSTWNVDAGVYWSGTFGEGNLFANNIVEHNRGYGLQLYPDAHYVIVTQNTFVDNGNSGILIAERASEGRTSDFNTVVNNIVAFNQRNKQIRVQSGNGNLIQNNVIYSPTSSLNGIENLTQSTATNNVFQDPRFANLLGHDFHLLEGSPAINFGLTDYSMQNDYDGACRPNNLVPDSGAFEH